MFSTPPGGAELTVMLTVNEFCRDYRISRTTAYRMMRDGTLPYTQVGGMRRIARADAEARLNNRGGAASGTAAA